MTNIGRSPPADVLQQWAILAADTTDPVPYMRNTALMAVSMLWVVLTCLAVAGRLYMRGVVQQNIDLSDWLILGINVRNTSKKHGLLFVCVKISKQVAAIPFYVLVGASMCRVETRSILPTNSAQADGYFI